VDLFGPPETRVENRVIFTILKGFLFSIFSSKNFNQISRSYLFQMPNKASTLQTI